MTREEIIQKHPIADVLAFRGMNLVTRGKEIVCLCPFHKDSSPSLRVNPEKQLWYCDPCATGGSVIDLIMKLDNLTLPQAMDKLAPAEAPPQFTKPKQVANYIYTDELGTELYRVIRYEPKTFRQCHKVGEQWVWNMEGVKRVLYRLPRVTKANRIWIVEGEKDADSLEKLGFIATCNVGGAGKWMDGYTETLKGKDVVICPDNDKAGQDHATKVIESLSGKVKAMRKVIIPTAFKDVSDFIASIPNAEDAADKLAAMADDATPIGQIDIPIYSMAELEDQYRQFVRTIDQQTLKFDSWLPKLGKNIRGLVPGEMAVFMADTGVGKTAILQNLAVHTRPLPTILFELELPGTLTFERFIQIDQGIAGDRVEASYKESLGFNWKQRGRLDHVFTCSISKLKPADIEKLIIQTELKMGKKPVVVMVDYIGLMEGEGKSRYERMSSVAEEMKRIAKSTNTIMILSTQIHRKDESKHGPEIFLHDAKDSGSIENSAGLVIAAWRDPEEASKMILKVRKATKGGGGTEVHCKFDGPTLRISEWQDYGTPINKTLYSE